MEKQGIKTETKSLPISHELANKIADALGVSKNAYRIEIIMDWTTRKREFSITVHSELRDEDGNIVLEAITGENAAVAKEN